MDKKEPEEEIDMAVKTPKKAQDELSVEEIRSLVKVIKPEVSKDGKLLLDKNNPDHVAIWED